MATKTGVLSRERKGAGFMVLVFERRKKRRERGVVAKLEGFFVKIKVDKFM